MIWSTLCSKITEKKFFDVLSQYLEVGRDRIKMEIVYYTFFATILIKIYDISLFTFWKLQLSSNSSSARTRPSQSSRATRSEPQTKERFHPVAARSNDPWPRKLSTVSQIRLWNDAKKTSETRRGEEAHEEETFPARRKIFPGEWPREKLLVHGDGREEEWQTLGLDPEPLGEPFANIRMQMKVEWRDVERKGQPVFPNFELTRNDTIKDRRIFFQTLNLCKL